MGYAFALPAAAAALTGAVLARSKGRRLVRVCLLVITLVVVFEALTIALAVVTLYAQPLYYSRHNVEGPLTGGYLGLSSVAVLSLRRSLTLGPIPYIAAAVAGAAAWMLLAIGYALFGFGGAFGALTCLGGFAIVRLTPHRALAVAVYCGLVLFGLVTAAYVWLGLAISDNDPPWLDGWFLFLPSTAIGASTIYFALAHRRSSLFGVQGRRTLLVLSAAAVVGAVALWEVTAGCAASQYCDFPREFPAEPTSTG